MYDRGKGAVGHMKPYLFDGFHKVSEVDTVIKGKKVKREKLHIKHAVAGLVIDENNRMALVMQYRPTIDKRIKEIPAGLLDKEDLTPLETLIEELEEECGIMSDEIISINDKPIHDYYMVVGSSDARISIYEVRVKAQVNKFVDDKDVEYVEWLTLEEVERDIITGLAPDPKTIISYYYFKELLELSQ